MRRKDREITSRKEIDGIIRGSLVCRLAMVAGDAPYLVPLSFGYDGSSIYLHTARGGKKIQCIEANSRVCFEFERNVKLVPGDKGACSWSLSYESVIGYGTIEELVAPEEKELGLNEIALQYSGKRWHFEDVALSKTRVWRISVDSMTGKRAQPNAAAIW